MERPPPSPADCKGLGNLGEGMTLERFRQQVRLVSSASILALSFLLASRNAGAADPPGGETRPRNQETRAVQTASAQTDTSQAVATADVPSAAVSQAAQAAEIVSPKQAPADQPTSRTDDRPGNIPPGEKASPIPSRRDPAAPPADSASAPAPEPGTAGDPAPAAQASAPISAPIPAIEQASPKFPPPPIDLNPIVEKRINFFAQAIRERFSLYLERSGRYISLMKEILRERNMPEDLVYLALIESGFSPHAFSRARASGPWQFISPTARRYGLEINWWVDERRDPVKSTIAAASYLKDLYEMFESWPLAMASYNAGEGRVMRAVRRTRTDDFWKIRNTRHLRIETRNYVPNYMAAVLIAQNPDQHGFDEIDYHAPFVFDLVTVDGPADLRVIAAAAGTTVEQIRELNPELKRWCTPPGSYDVRVPKGSREAFVEAFAKIPADERIAWREHTVRKGETLKSIAGKYRVSAESLEAINGQSSKKPLRVGSEILVPPQDEFVLALAKATRDEVRRAGKSKKKVTTAAKKKGGPKVAKPDGQKDNVTAKATQEAKSAAPPMDSGGTQSKKNPSDKAASLAAPSSQS
ncbi:MAG: transglycosylase SLT domain-containing protein [Nitrospirae bacterium]|nr:transglycosylase SLT domain-containing protein [Nitrospirota bacterium]